MTELGYAKLRSRQVLNERGLNDNALEKRVRNLRSQTQCHLRVDYLAAHTTVTWNVGDGQKALP